MNLPNEHLLQNGKYRLTHVVGQGGFGITYKGVWYTEVKGPLGTVKTEVPICIKEYFFKDYCYRDPDTLAVRVHSETGKQLFDKFKEKLIKEARILSEVHHPYIVNVLEVFEEHNTAYIAMEYIDGYSLKSLLEKEGMLPENQVLYYIRQIGEALQFVHEKNILHLDIKPSNILIDKKGNARLIDFGVSKRYDIEQEETSTTMLTLSKGFAAIEQYDNEGIQQFSPCPDIYSLGATIYNLLTGKIPTESILRATRLLKRPRELNPAISEQTEAVILKAMQIIPSDRYASIKELLNKLPQTTFKPILPTTHTATSPTEEETTLVYQDNNQSPRSTDEEETMVTSPSSQPKEEQVQSPSNRLSRIKRIVAMLIGFVALVSAAFAIFWQHEDTEINTKTTSLQEGSILTESLSTVAKKEEQTGEEGEAANEEPIKENKPAPPTTGAETPTSSSTVTISAQQEERQQATTLVKPLDSKPTPPPMNVESLYQALLQSGKEKLAKADFAGARTDLTQAKETKLTEEIVRLLIQCDEEEEQRQIADRIAQYEEKMAFGQYKIVRKKANNKYGAIDMKGEERIPCKYISVGIAEQGRAFERPDNLFDIYNTDGILIGEGLSYY
ncbi:MAG: serine/threonine protein kinase [Parabacteroides sp.]